MISWWKFYRELINHPKVGFKKPFKKSEAWIWMINEAQFKDNQDYRDFGGKERIIDMPRGTLTHSYRFMANAWGWSRQKVRRFLKCLENEQQVSLKVVQQMTQITICNYEKYQYGGKQQEVQQNDSRMTAEGQQNDKLKNDKNDKNVYICVQNFAKQNPAAHRICNKFLSTLDETEKNIKPKTNDMKLKWLKCAKWAINKMGNHGEEKVIDIIEYYRNVYDEENNNPKFSWRKNFQSLLKLKKLNTEGIYYLDYFWSHLEGKVKYDTNGDSRQKEN